LNTAPDAPADTNGFGHGLLQNLVDMERTREHYWRRFPQTSPTKLRWRANAVRHALHVTVGDRVLELGAGGGLWTGYLERRLPDSSVTAAVFNADLAEVARADGCSEVRHVTALADLEPESFDVVVGTAILSHDRYRENLDWIHALLRPRGGMLFFEANYWNPQVFMKAQSVRLARWSGNSGCQIALRKPMLSVALRRQRFVDPVVVPYDILHPRTPAPLVPALQSAAFVAEHLPAVREACGTLFIYARRGDSPLRRPRPDLTEHERFVDAVSVVVPCHNEEENAPRLVAALTQSYSGYLREIILVNDNSQDETAAVVDAMAAQDGRVRVIHRSGPPGVGRALREGYAATSGTWILSLDCDFEMLVPELRDMFDAVADGHDGAIGSRFSHESVLLNYPAGKLLGNRAFHVLVRCVTRHPVRDVSNNLKLYRGDLLRGMSITQDGFAANAEIGLKPILAGADIAEVPMAWINREADMGASNFKVLRVAPGYAAALLRMMREHGRPGRRAPFPGPH